MNIAVLIKQVPVSNNISVDPETHALVRESSEGMINPADLNAIESALILKEKTEGKVVVFTMGPQDAEKALRDAMALGCDESCLITDRVFAGGDTVATAKVLAASIKKYGSFDLIMSGALSADGATGQVGAMVAECMNMPHVAEIQSVDLDQENNNCIEVIKKVHDDKVRARVVLPAVVSLNFGCNEPRLATLRTKRAAKTKPLAVYTNAELEFDSAKTGLIGSPTVAIDSFEPECAKKATFLQGSIEELAKQLNDLIEEEKGK